jgi:hypothetical protein
MTTFVLLAIFASIAHPIASTAMRRAVWRVLARRGPGHGWQCFYTWRPEFVTCWTLPAWLPESVVDRITPRSYDFERA